MAVLCLLIVHLKKLHSGNFELFTIDLIIEYVYMIKQSSLIMSFYGQKNQSLHLHVCRQKKINQCYGYSSSLLLHAWHT